LKRAAVAGASARPPTPTDRSASVPERDITATSVVAAPSSQIALARTSAIGNPAPIAAASGSSMSHTCLAPAAIAASVTARRSPDVNAEGTDLTQSGLNRRGRQYLL